MKTVKIEVGQVALVIEGDQHGGEQPARLHLMAFTRTGGDGRLELRATGRDVCEVLRDLRTALAAWGAM